MREVCYSPVIHPFAIAPAFYHVLHLFLSFFQSPISRVGFHDNNKYGLRVDGVQLLCAYHGMAHDGISPAQGTFEAMWRHIALKVYCVRERGNVPFEDVCCLSSSNGHYGTGAR